MANAGGTAFEHASLATPITRVARFRIGDYRVAIDARMVEHVHAKSFAIVPLPMAPAHVPGAIRIEDRAIPLLDVEALFGGGREAPCGNRLTVVLRHDDGHFAISADELLGLTRVREHDFAEVSVQHPTADGVFTKLFSSPESETAEVLLDLEALVRVGGLHTARAARASTSARGLTAGPTYFVVQVGDKRLAFDAKTVRQVQANASVERVGFSHPALIGFHRFAGEQIAVVDVAVILGWRGSAEDAARRSFIVIDDARGAPIALVVSAILDMERTTGSSRPCAPADGEAANDFWHHSYESEAHGLVMVADSAAIWAASRVVDSRGLFAASQADATAALDRQLRPLFVYRAAGGLLTSPVSGARAVLTLPKDFVDLRGQRHGVVGLFAHAHGTIRVLDLSALMGGAAIAQPVGRPTLVFDSPRGPIGLLVDEVIAMRQGATHALSGASRRPYGVIPAFAESAPMHIDGADRGVAVLDLAALHDYPAFAQYLEQLHDVRRPDGATAQRAA
ncbi:chemotaxis protein CheW [Gemmatimonas sp.]